jgi:hypothetical protein
MNYKLYTIFSLILISTISHASSPAEIRRETISFFNNKLLPSCTLKPKSHSFSNLEKFFIGLVQSIGTTGPNLEENTYFTGVERYINVYNCDLNLFYELKNRINKDSILAHKDYLKLIQNQIEQFRAKNLLGSPLIAKYLNYNVKNNLNLELSPDVIKLESLNKVAIETRKNSCTNIVNLNLPLKLDEPKNQDTIGWCYAYTASDLIAHAIGKNPSAVYTALLTNDHFFKKISGYTEGGFINSAIEDSKTQGICLEQDLPSSDYEFSKLGYDLNQFYNEIDKLGEQYRDKKIHNIPALLCSKIVQVFPNLDLIEFDNILLNSSKSDTFKKLADKNCKLYKGDDLKSLRINTISNQKNIFPTIDEQLNKGNIIGIAYKGNILTGFQNNSPYANHASSIIGRRFNDKNNSCEYLIRNSYGKDCVSYSKDYECQNGNVWIAEEYFKFNQAIQEVTYVEKK